MTKGKSPTTPAESVRDGKPNWPVVLRLWAEWSLWAGEPPDKSDYLAVADEIDRLRAENSALKRDLILCDQTQIDMVKRIHGALNGQ